jgi:hypothetical protein
MNIKKKAFIYNNKSGEVHIACTAADKLTLTFHTYFAIILLPLFISYNVFNLFHHLICFRALTGKYPVSSHYIILRICKSEIGGTLGTYWDTWHIMGHVAHNGGTHGT